MKISNKGITLISKLEGFRSKPYLDSANVATIGYGSTFYLDGRRVKMTDKPISKDDAHRLLSIVANKFAVSVDKYTTACLNQNQFDALVSFTYNVGVGAFKNSTLLKVVNKDPNNFDEVNKQLMRWVRAGGKVLDGLKKRRSKEIELYNEIDN